MQKFSIYTQRYINWLGQHKKWVIGTALSVLVLLIACNVVLAWYFADHLLPGASIGSVDVSYLTPTQAYEQLTRVTAAPIKLDFAGRAVDLKPQIIEASYDLDATVKLVQDQSHPFIPMFAWLPANRQIVADVTFNPVLLKQQSDQLAQAYSTSPTDAALTVKNGQAVIADQQLGHHFTSDQVARQIEDRLRYPSRENLRLDSQVSQPHIQSDQLQPALRQLSQKILLTLKLTYLENVYAATAEQIGSWFTTDTQLQLVLNNQGVAEYVANIAKDIDQPALDTIITTKDGLETGRQPGKDGVALDQAAAVAALTTAINQTTSLQYQLTTAAIPLKTEYVRTYSPRLPTYTYCVAAKDVDASYLDQFAASIAQTLSDSRGWSLGGKIKFQQVQSGCGMKLWLSAASALPTFSSGCSALYSCRAGSNVIINVDPWLHATPTWNSHGGSLADYQALVVNHEVGHWLGFDHRHCGSPGQLAPVMQQQSIDLEGCQINAWPLASEITALKVMKGL